MVSDLGSPYLFLGLVLFAIGVALVLTRRNIIATLAGVELILNAANINWVYFSSTNSGSEGQLFALFLLVIAAGEAAVALALIRQIYKFAQTTDADRMSTLK